jgi:hypothetical protein
MTSRTLGPVFHVKGGFAVVTGPAKMALRDLAHVHLVRPLFHLEDPEVTTRACAAVRLNVFLMVEQDRGRALGLEAYVAAPDQNLRGCSERQYEAEQERKNDDFPFHGTSSFSCRYAGTLLALLI